MLRDLFGKDDLEKKIEINEKKFKELQAKIAELDRETAEVFEQLEVTPEQIEKCLNDKENFSEKDWEELQRQMAEFEAKAQAGSDISKIRRAYKERSEIQRNWLFVR